MTSATRLAISAAALFLIVLASLPISHAESGPINETGPVLPMGAGFSPYSDRRTCSTFGVGDEGSIASWANFSSDDGRTMSFERNDIEHYYDLRAGKDSTFSLNGARNILTYDNRTFVGIVHNGTYKGKDWVSFHLAVHHEALSFWDPPVLVHNMSGYTNGHCEVHVRDGYLYFLMTAIGADPSNSRLYIKKISCDVWPSIGQVDLQLLDDRGYCGFNTKMVNSAGRTMVFWATDVWGHGYYSAEVGGSWSSPYKVREGVGVMTVIGYDEAGESGILFIYTSSGSETINLTRSINGGSSWSPTMIINTTGTGNEVLSSARFGGDNHLISVRPSAGEISYFTGEKWNSWTAYEVSDSISPTSPDGKVEAQIAVDRSQVWIIAEDGPGSVKGYASDRGEYSFRENLHITGPTVSSAVISADKRYLAYHENEYLRFHRFTLSDKGHLETAPFSVPALSSWEDIGIDILGFDGGSVGLSVHSHDGGEVRKVYPETGTIEVLDLGSGIIEGDIYGHKVEMQGDWTSGEGLAENISVRLDLRRPMGSSPRFFSMVLNYSTSPRTELDFDNPLHVVSTYNTTTGPEGMVLDEGACYGEAVIGPLETEEGWPDVLGLMLRSYHSKVHVKVEVQDRHGRPITGFSMVDSSMMDDVGKLGYIRWSGKHFGDLSEINSLVYLRVMIWCQETTADPVVEYLTLKDSTPPYFDDAGIVDDTVLRGETAKLSVYTGDHEEPPDWLDVGIEHRIEGESLWSSEMMEGALFSEDHWEFRISTDHDTQLGRYHFRASVTDRSGDLSVFEMEPTLSVTNNLPTPPMLRSAPDRPKVANDINITFAKRGTDIETPKGELTYNITIYLDDTHFRDINGFSGNSLLIEGEHVLKEQKWRVEVSTWDGVDLSEPAVIEIDTFNSPPIFTGENAKIDLLEDGGQSRYPLDEWFLDPDGENLSFEYRYTDGLEVEIDDMNGLLVRGLANFNGEGRIWITAEDGPFHITAEIPVTISSVNDPPVLSVQGYVETVQGEWTEVLVGACDPCDGDMITISNDVARVIPGIEEGKNYMMAPNGSFSILPGNEMVGNHTVTVSATDGILWDNVSVQLVIENLNDPPGIPKVEVLNAEGRGGSFVFREGDPIALSSEVDDPDVPWGDQLTYYWLKGEEQLAEGKDVELFLEPGRHNITLEVSDSGGEVSTVTFSIEVLPEEPDRGEVMTTSTLLTYVGLGTFLVGIVLALLLIILARKRKKARDDGKNGGGEEDRKEGPAGKVYEKGSKSDDKKDGKEVETGTTGPEKRSGESGSGTGEKTDNGDQGPDDEKKDRGSDKETSKPPSNDNGGPGKAVAFLLVFLMAAVPLIGSMGQASDPEPDLPGSNGYHFEEMEVGSLQDEMQPGEILGTPSHISVNIGQLDNDDILFYTAGGGLEVGFGTDFLTYLVHGSEKDHVYFVRFPGSNHCVPQASEPSDHRSNYFMGPDEQYWYTDVLNYRSVLYRDLYDGIDLVYYIKDGRLKYDLNVEAGAAPEEFRMEFDGVEPLISGKTLELRTPAGTVTEDPPLSYTEEGVRLTSRWMKYSRNVFGFEVEGWDRISDLIIDPGLTFSTFLGGSQEDRAYDIVVDDSGYTYLTGLTKSSSFPTVSGSYDTGLTGNSDAFILKLDKDGSSLIYSTYLGGTQDEEGWGIDVDGSGNAYVVGDTTSWDFPTTSGAYSVSWRGGGDIFVTKLNPNGNSLSFSTYLGGRGADYGRDIVIDSSGNAYVTGTAGYSQWQWWRYPTTSGAYDTSHNGGADTMVTKLRANGRSLIYSTFLGASGDETSYGIDLDSDNNAYVTGRTDSSGYPTTSGAYDSTINGNEDTYVTKLSSDGSSLSYSTFLGGAGRDRGYDLAVNSTGCAFVVGETGSGGANPFPTTSGAYDTDANGGYDAFLTVVSDDGATLDNSTYIGSSGVDTAYSIFLLDDGSSLIGGTTGSSSFPVTDDAVFGTKQGSMDMFAMKFEVPGGGLQYSTFVGGSSTDVAYGIQGDATGFIYLAGYTGSLDFPTSRDCFDPTYGGGGDAVSLRFFPEDFSPRNLTGEAGHFYVNISWEPPEWKYFSKYTFQSYKVYRGLSADEMKIHRELGNVTHFNDTIRFFLSRNYTYFVTAVFQTLRESSETEYLAFKPLVTPPPDLPNANAGDMFINLTWEVMDAFYTDMFDINYHVYRGIEPDSLHPIEDLGTSAWFNDTDLFPGPRTYYYALSYSVGGIGQGNYSPIIEGQARTPPGSPEIEHVETYMGGFNLTWTPHTNEGGYPTTSFVLFRGLSSDTMEEIAVLESDEVHFNDTGLTPGNIYHYEVVAENALGGSVPSKQLILEAKGVPSAPTSLGAAAYDGNVELEWAPPEYFGGSGLRGYMVYRRNASGTSFPLAELGPGTLTLTDSVENGIEYLYCVSAFNEYGEGQRTEEVKAYPTGTPSKVTLEDISWGDGWIEVEWNDVGDDGGLPVLGFKVYRGPQAAAINSLVATLPPGARGFRDDDLTNGDPYFYSVSAFNSNGEGVKSDAMMAIPGSPPGVVETISAEPGLHKVTITWDPPEDIGGTLPTYAKLFRGRSPSSLRPYFEVPYGEGVYVDDGLPDDGPYYYAVSIINSVGEGRISSIVEAEPYGEPSSPWKLNVTGGSRWINLTWEPPTETGGLPLTGYDVELRSAGDSDWTVYETEENEYDIVGLIGDRSYEVRVRAVNPLTGGDYTESVNIIVGDPPKEPLGFTATGEDSKVRLRWESRPLSRLPVTAYRIYESVRGSELELLTEVDSSVSRFTVEGLINGWNYSYAVSSVNQLGEGPMTHIKSVVPFSSPGSVRDLRVDSSGDERIVITWSPPPNDCGSPVQYYSIFRGIEEDDMDRIKTGLEETGYLDDDVENGVVYLYRVSATNEGGEGAKSGTIEGMAVGLPTAPRQLKASSSTDRIDLEWKRPSSMKGGSLEGYVLYRSEGGGGSELIAYLGPNETSFTDKDVSKGSYTYSLVAYNQKGTGTEALFETDVPGRGTEALLLAAAMLLLPLIVGFLIVFVPGFLKKRAEKRKLREEEEEREKRKKERERLEEEHRRKELSLSLGTKRASALSTSHSNGTALPPGKEEKVGESDTGYIRPTKASKKKKDKKKILRADGKSLEDRLKDDDEKNGTANGKNGNGIRMKEEWERERRKALEKESESVFTGQQPEEKTASGEDMTDDIGPEPPKKEDETPSVDAPDESEPGDSGEKGTEGPESIPEWGEEEVPLADIPEVDEAQED